MELQPALRPPEPDESIVPVELFSPWESSNVMRRRQEHILIVDDFKDTREMYGCFLPLRGFRVSLASNGQEALDMAFAEAPDAIIMDLSMPVMNGWEATRRLKADERTRHIPVLMLTASPMGGLTPTVVEAGFSAVLVKPCMPDEVVREIFTVLDARPKRGSPKPSRRRAAEAACGSKGQ